MQTANTHQGGSALCALLLLSLRRRILRLFLLAPRDFEAVDTMARAALPIPDGFEAATMPTPGAAVLAEDRSPNPVPVRAGEVSPMQLVREINGRPPDGQRCD